MNAIINEIDIKANLLRESILNAESDYKCEGTAYYVSNNGSDDNDGLSPATPWKTLEKASNFPYNAGDVILLERGSVFRETMRLKCEHTTLSAYGEGAKPQIIGSPKNYATPEDWEKTEYENVYVCTTRFKADVGNMVFNEGENYGLKQIIYNFGFMGDLSELKNDLEFYRNEETEEVFLYSIGNPAERFNSIELCIHTSICVEADYTTIDNICTKYNGGHSIGSGTRRGLTVQNCEIGWVGGSIQYKTPEGVSVRFGNGIEIYVECFDFKVKNCYIYECYDAGVTHQYFQDAKRDIFMENIEYSNNLIENCVYSIEYALAKQTGANQHMHNVLIADNIMRNAGCGFGKQRPDKGGAAHIKSWETCNEAKNYVVKNNIFDRGEYKIIFIAAHEEESLPELIGNTYVQYEGRKFGRYSKTPSKLYYTDEAKELLKSEKDAKIYII